MNLKALRAGCASCGAEVSCKQHRSSANQEAWVHYCDFNIIEKAQAYMRRNED